jgi:ribonuclease P protein component
LLRPGRRTLFIKKNSFSRTERIRKSREITGLRKSAKKVIGKHYVVIWKLNSLKLSRLGVIVSKKNRTAVKRNYEKRIIREIFRQNKSVLSQKIDLLIIKKNINDADFKQKEKELKELLARIKH